MKIVMLNTSDRQGGAAVAASRLKEALCREGIEVKMIVRDKTSDDPGVVSINNGWFRRQVNRFRFLWERWVIWTHNGFSREKLFQVSVADTGTNVSKMPEVRRADIIHLHWINQGFLSLKDLEKLMALGKPIVWTMHDMWPVTGICHHAWDCTRYRTECGKCPFLGAKYPKDLSRKVFRKKKTLSPGLLAFVPVSRWLGEKCQESAIGKGVPSVVIPNAIDTERFSPDDKSEARKKFGIPADKKMLVLGAARIDDPVKGFPLLKEALESIPESRRKNMVLFLFGRIKDPAILSGGFPVEIRYWGPVGGPDTLAAIYRAADITVSSSHYETFGQTISEAMACGCPAVSFGNSGQQDIIDHLENGWLAQYPDPQDLARGIEWVLDHPDPEELARRAREKIVALFSIEKVTGQYLSLYRSLLPLPDEASVRSPE